MSINKQIIEEKVYEQLHTVNDPEIPVDIVELGLIYGVEVNDAGYVNITMTLTAPACPVAGEIVLEVDRKVREIEGVSDVNVMLTFTPAWTKDRMSEVAKLELGFL